MNNNKENYLEIHVGINTRAQWYQDLQGKMKTLNVECRQSRFHITAVFLKDDSKKELLKEAFSKSFCDLRAPVLTFDKMNAFTSKSGKEHIVYLTATRPDLNYMELIYRLEKDTKEVGVEPEGYLMHVTLARVPVNVISLEDLKKLIAEIPLSKFRLPLTTIEYRYRNPDLNKGLIEKWILNN